MRRLVVIALVACSQPQPAGPAWPKAAAIERDGGESLEPRAAARAIAAAVENDGADPSTAADKPDAAASSATGKTGATSERPAAPAGTMTVIEEPITAEDIVIEIDDRDSDGGPDGKP